MLDKAFMGHFFNQLGVLTDDELAVKEAAITKLLSTFEKGSDAQFDARFMLKHIRREQLERLFNQPKST